MKKYDFNKNVRLEDDLYNYVNGQWIKKTKIPADKPCVGGFVDLNDDVEKIMLRDFKKLSKKPSQDELLNRAVLLYQKVLDEENRIQGMDFLFKKLSFLDSICDKESFVSSLYYLYDNNYPLPFNFIINEDMKDATKYSLCLSGPSTILPDTTMYDSPQAQQIIGIYQTMVVAILNKLNIGNVDDLITKTLSFDDKIRKLVKSSEEWADYIKTYNPYKLEEVNAMLDFSLDSLLVSRFGKKVEQVIVYEPRFFNAFKEFMQDSYLEYQAWAKVNLILEKAKYLSEELRDLSGIYMRALSGTAQMASKEKFAYGLANSFYGEVLGVYYGKKYFGEEAKQDVISIVKNLIQSYKERLSKNTWLSQATIDKAIVKLDKMEIKIGYPDKIDNKYYLLAFSNNQSLIEIVDSLIKIISNYNDQKLFKPVDRSIWVMPGNMVNACYNPSANDITFPAAILRAPFYSINQTIEENYGGIGCVIGHEISHAFDNNGAQMDELGNICNWWTEEDYKNFQVKTEQMIEQFDGLPLLDAKVNGKLSVSENIADNGGIASSLQSLKRVKGDADLTKFFINYAKIWCLKAKPEYTKLLLTVDVHGPNYYRANMQVKNFDEFHQAFNIQETDQMYLEPSKRLIIW